MEHTTHGADIYQSPPHLGDKRWIDYNVQHSQSHSQYRIACRNLINGSQWRRMVSYSSSAYSYTQNNRIWKEDVCVCVCYTKISCFIFTCRISVFVRFHAFPNYIFRNRYERSNMFSLVERVWHLYNTSPLVFVLIQRFRMFSFGTVCMRTTSCSTCMLHLQIGNWWLCQRHWQVLRFASRSHNHNWNWYRDR